MAVQSRGSSGAVDVRDKLDSSSGSLAVYLLQFKEGKKRKKSRERPELRKRASQVVRRIVFLHKNGDWKEWYLK